MHFDITSAQPGMLSSYANSFVFQVWRRFVYTKHVQMLLLL